MGARPDSTVRDFLLNASDEIVEVVLRPRELEALRFGYRESVTDTHLKHVRELPFELPEIFAAAANRAREAGFDGVELHYAHAYTMAGFLSAQNDRNDGYGGTHENRVRLPLEVYREVRNRVGNDYVVGVRFLADEVIAGGSRIDDAIYYAKNLPRLVSIFFRSRRAVSLRMRNNRRSGRPSILTRAKADMSACRQCSPTRQVHSDEPFHSSLRSNKK